MKASRVVRFTAVMLSVPKVAFAANGLSAIAIKIFGWGGIGFPIVTLLLLSIVSNLSAQLAGILGGPWPEFIRSVSLFVGIGVVITAATGALYAILRIMGIA